MKELNIKGYTVLLDDEDYERVAALKWYVQKNLIKTRGRVYFYHAFYENGKKIYTQSLQRFIIGLGHKDGYQGDHISGDTLDNRKSNLRKCSISENTQNAKMHKDNLTGYKGITLFKRTGQYVAKICVNRKQFHLGYFDTPEEAHEAYCKASKELHGEFSRVE